MFRRPVMPASIPAIFAIIDDPFLVFSSNVFVMLGLRSLYFALAGVMYKLYYLKATLAIMMGLIGVKMLLKDVLEEVPGITCYALGAIALMVGIGVAASLIRAQRTQVGIDDPGHDEAGEVQGSTGRT